MSSRIDSSLKAKGEVIALIRDTRTGATIDSFAPKVRFVTSDGAVYIHSSSVYSKPSQFDVGEEVVIFYKPQDPQGTAVIQSFFTLWGVSMVLYLIGSVFLLLGGVFIYYF